MPMKVSELCHRNGSCSHIRDHCPWPRFCLSKVYIQCSQSFVYSPNYWLVHSFDLVPSKQFCDDAYLVFRKVRYGNEMSKCKLVRVANQRICDLSGDTECRGMQPFKTTEYDRQASYTGKERIVLCPVLWSAVMRLSPSIRPDEDDVLKSALYLVFLQSELKGINRCTSTRSRTEEEIDELQETCIDACNHVYWMLWCQRMNQVTSNHGPPRCTFERRW